MSYTFIDGEQLTAAKLNEHCVNRPSFQAKRGISIPSGSGGTNVTVTFTTPMASTPAVVLGVSHPNITHWRVTSATETGFTARFDRSGSGSYTFDYIAAPET